MALGAAFARGERSDRVFRVLKVASAAFISPAVVWLFGHPVGVRLAG
jgi:hypothetical protein